ncbi:hypothetical protein V6N00_10910 [Tersicoccus sp. MR15.9]|uniref:hypothetical protein n=1 Tax=Tersicoccus mangrovi TaxID=3121635 RepID=UPI002FE5A5B9
MDPAVTFEKEDGLWAQFPYSPYVPAGIPSTADPGDRRVVGRTSDGAVVCVTDFPRYFSLDDSPSALNHPLQFFPTARTYLDWLAETCRRTRFPAGLDSADPARRFDLALQAMLFGLECDLDGLIQVHPLAVVPFGIPRRKEEFAFRPVDVDTWEVLDADGRVLSPEEREAVLDRGLWDVASGGNLRFITEELGQS